MSETHPLITVCVCTYKRPVLLNELLISLTTQTLTDFDIVVVDNDARGSATATVENFRRNHAHIPTNYAIESRQGISYARNRTVAMATGEFIAFIDDDEVADSNWLQDHHDCLISTNADATLGPVLPVFPLGSKQWAVMSRLFDRPRYQNASKVRSGDGRTGNALVKSKLCKLRKPTCFKEDLAKSGGEDHDFFKWMESKGGVFFWTDSAIVRETVPLDRQKIYLVLERRFRSSTTYWRGENTNRSSFASINEAALGIAGGLIFALIGVAALPTGLVRALPFWVKAANGFGRAAALSAIQLVGYGGKDE